MLYRSNPLIIDRFQDEKNERISRIAAACRDGSIKLLSPVSGQVITTLFPTDKDTFSKELIYDLNEERLYSYCMNGEFIIYDTSTAPARILEVWPKHARDEITAICNVTSKIRRIPHQKKQPLLTIAKTTIFVGTKDGQISDIDLTNQGRLTTLAQAHTGQVEFLLFDETRNLLVSGGSGTLTIRGH